MTQFTDTYGWRDGLAAPKAFGARLQAPQQPRYVVWSELLGREHTSIISAPDAFQARQQFAAAHPAMLVIDCCARRVDMIDPSFRSQFPAFALPVDLPRR